MMELDGSQLVVLKNLTAVSFSKNHDTVTQDNPQTLLQAAFSLAATVKISALKRGLITTF